MQRQSLGSPVAKIHLSPAGGATGRASQPKEAGEEREIKEDKQIRGIPRVERVIHLIPLLTILCLLILFLFSHDPSSKDMEALGGASARRRGVRGKTGAEKAARAILSNRGLKAEAGRGRKLRIGRPGTRT